MSFNNIISKYATYNTAVGNGWEAADADYGACAHSFPQGLECLIQRLEIVCGGVSLITLPNYNTLYQVLKDINQNLNHRISRNICEGENSVLCKVDQAANGSGKQSNDQLGITCFNWFVQSIVNAPSNFTNGTVIGSTLIYSDNFLNNVDVGTAITGALVSTSTYVVSKATGTTTSFYGSTSGTTLTATEVGLTVGQGITGGTSAGTVITAIGATTTRSFNGTISSTTLTVNSGTAPVVGALITGTGVAAGTYVTAVITASTFTVSPAQAGAGPVAMVGTTRSYTISNSQTVALQAMDALSIKLTLADSQVTNINKNFTALNTTGFAVSATAYVPRSFASTTTGYYVINAPPPSFFGFDNNGAAYSNIPYIDVISPRQFKIIDSEPYTAFHAYNITLTYAFNGTLVPTLSTATGTKINTSQVYSGIPFSVIAASDYVNGIGNASIQSQNAQSNTIRDFLSFFKAMPKTIQLDALGEIEVRVYLEDSKKVITSMAPAQTTSMTTFPIQQTSADYTLKNIEFQIRTMSWDNNWLNSEMKSVFDRGESIDIPFPNYYSIVQSGQGQGATQTRFSVNTQNLRQVWAVNKPSFNFANQNYRQQLLVPSGLGIDNYTGEVVPTYKGWFFAHHAGNPSAWATLPQDPGSSYLNKPAAQANKWNFLINNQQIPNFPISPTRTYAFTQEILDKKDWQEGTAIGTPLIYYTSGYAMGISMEYMDKYEDVRNLYGLDTRSSSSTFTLNQSNNIAGDSTYIFALFTSVLRVSKNKNMQLII
jgi:hypothetical protein